MAENGICQCSKPLIREKGHDINYPITEKDIDDYLTLSNNPPDLLTNRGRSSFE